MDIFMQIVGIAEVQLDIMRRFLLWHIIGKGIISENIKKYF